MRWLFETLNEDEMCPASWLGKPSQLMFFPRGRRDICRSLKRQTCTGSERRTSKNFSPSERSRQQITFNKPSLQRMSAELLFVYLLFLSLFVLVVDLMLLSSCFDVNNCTVYIICVLCTFRREILVIEGLIFSLTAHNTLPISLWFFQLIVTDYPHK